MSLRFRQLQAFHAIMESGTVTAAAEQLGISQPGISNLLSQLERETRVQLFAREKGRLMPTPEADLLFREVDTVVRGIDHVSQAVTDLQNKQAGQLQVASQHSLSFGFMPPLIAEFARTKPEMSISFQSQYSSKIQEWVLSGLFEIGVCEMPILHHGLTAYPFQLECRLALPAGHRLERHAQLTPELLAGETIIAMGPDHMTHRRMRSAFQDAGITWAPRVHTHLFKNVVSFVREGLGVALLDRPALDFDQSGRVTSRAFLPLVAMDMAIVVSRTRPLSAVGREFLELLIDRLEPVTLGGVHRD